MNVNGSVDCCYKRAVTVSVSVLFDLTKLLGLTSVDGCIELIGDRAPTLGRKVEFIVIYF